MICRLHRSLTVERWAARSLAFRMGNIGSEISRGLTAQRKQDQVRLNGCMDRALELIDLTIEVAQLPSSRAEHPGALRELCRLRECVLDYFLGGNTYHTDGDRLLQYFDDFGLVYARRRYQEQMQACSGPAEVQQP